MTHRTLPFVALMFVLLGHLAPAAAAQPSADPRGMALRLARAAPGGAGPEEACAGRASGDACTLPNNQLGTCAAATCNRLDYSGGSPPKAIEEACIVCKPAGGQPHDGPPILGGDGGASPSDADAGGEGEPSSSGAEGKEPPESKSRCRLDPDDPNPAGLALLAGLLLIGFLHARRRSV